MVCLNRRSTLNNEVDATGSYWGFRVSRTKSDATSLDAVRRQFPQAVVDNMKVRFPDQQILAADAGLSPSNWPSNEEELSVYGWLVGCGWLVGWLVGCLVGWAFNNTDVIKLARLGLLQVDTVQAVDQFRI